MTVVAWIVEGSWPAVIDAVRTHALAETEIVLLHVADAAVPEVAHGAYAGLLGRGHRERDPGTSLEHLSSASAAGLLDAAAERLARPCTRQQRLGRPEREVVAAGEGAELLIPPAPCCWSGQHTRPPSTPSRPRRRTRRTGHDPQRIGVSRVTGGAEVRHGSARAASHSAPPPWRLDRETLAGSSPSSPTRS